MSLTSLLGWASPVRDYLDGISPRLQASSGRGEGASTAAEELGLLELTDSRLVISPLPGVDLPRSGTAFDFRARIELGGFAPDQSVAAQGVAQLGEYVPYIPNGPHRARIISESFAIAKGLLLGSADESELDRAAILLAHCEQVVRAGAGALNGSVGDACDAAADGQAFADQLDPLALADVRSLMLMNVRQLETWHEQIADGERYEPNPSFISSPLVGGADADWMVGETLIDCKVYGSLTVNKLWGFLRQLLGYVMLDSDDSLGIRRVGLWLPRQGLTPTWNLTQLLSGDPEELLLTLRKGFIKATGKKQIAIRVPLTTRRQHQLLADNRHTRYEMLTDLARSDDPDVRRRVGRNAVTPEATVRILARDSRWNVREGVATNEATPDDVLAVLSHDRSAAVRRAVAANPGAPKPVLKALSADTDRDVQWAARTNGVTGSTLARSASRSLSDAGLREVSISSARDESIMDSYWFVSFLQSMGAGGELPIPSASSIWGSMTGRARTIPAWLREELPDDVKADLIRAHRPTWVRQSMARGLPVSDASVRERLLTDVDPGIRWQTLLRTVDLRDEALGFFLAELAASKQSRLNFRTTGMGPRQAWASTAAEFQDETLKLVASHPSTPYPALLTLMESNSASALLGLAENPALPAVDRASIIESMRTSKSANAREMLATLETLPEAVLLDLASDKNAQVREAVAENCSAPPAVFNVLAADPVRSVRFSVLGNYGAPPAAASTAAESLLQQDADENLYEVLEVIDERADLDLPARTVAAALDRLSKSRVRDPDLRLVVARNEQAGETTLSRLSRSAVNGIREAVAGNSTTHPSVLAQLATDPEPGVRTAVGRNLDTPIAVLIALSHDDEDRVRAGTADNSNLPPGILRNLLSDASPRVRSAALRNPAMPAEVVAKEQIERRQANTPQPDRAAREEMVASSRAQTRLRVAFLPDAEPDLLVFLGGEKSVQVRRVVAANPHTPAVVLESLAAGTDEQVLRSLAFNGASSESLLLDLAARRTDLAILVALNPDAAVSVLDSLANDADSLIRFIASRSRQARLAVTGRTPDQALAISRRSNIDLQ
jgi:hypothetical protein